MTSSGGQNYEKTQNTKPRYTETYLVNCNSKRKGLNETEIDIYYSKLREINILSSSK